ncbi:zinc finger DZIP1 [Pelobates cultripes]|uniref:Zinc finger DZIP1 n=1 Tax=Pelobates cultripes TaxID=61616 RepID=A0AAD1R4N1_PELCU|nr:zinc finger DZIP1 [Pelobates cultripes]
MVTVRTTRSPLTVSLARVPGWSKGEEMPFYDNIYYPFEVDQAQLFPSLQNNPCVSHPLSTPFRMPFANKEPVFKFRSRHESVDWRRIGAIDVDKVANELDFITLQDIIMNVTFCNVDKEKCPNCQQNLDPLFLKLLRLAQLLIEYLLHSQEYLTTNVQTLEQKVQVTLSETTEMKLKMVKQAQEIKTLKDECKHRKKIIATQQMLINSGANSYNKCHSCDKAFLNYSYLQSHIQRRHADETSNEKSKVHLRDKLQCEITQLKEELQLAKCQLQAEKAVSLEKLAKVTENEQREAIEEEIRKRFDSWKSEEKEKFADKMEKVKDMFMSELKELNVKNSCLEKELHELKESRFINSGLGVLQGSLRNNEEMSNCSHDIETVKEILQTQEDKWGNKIRLIRQEHNKEKNQLLSQMEKLRLSMSEEQKARSDFYQKRLDELERRLQEQNEFMRTWKEQINEVSVKPITSVGRHPVTESSAMSQQLATKSSSSLTWEIDVEKPPNIRHQKVINTLKMNQPHSRELRTILEQTLAEKLESLGVKPGARGIPHEQLNKIVSQVESVREGNAKRVPEMDHIRVNLARCVNSLVEERTTSFKSTSQVLSDFKTSASGSTSSVLLPKQSKSKVSTTKPSQEDFQTEPKKLTPEPQYTLPLKSSTPKVMLVSAKDFHVPKQSSIGTPPFSSDDESDDSKSAKQPLKCTNTFKPNSLFDWKGNQGFAVNDSDSEGSLLEAVEPQSVHRNSIQKQPPVKPTRATMVKDRTEQFEKQLSTYSTKHKPVNGIDVIQPFVKKDAVMELKAGDLDDSDFDSTSLEEEAFEVPRSVKKRQDTAIKKKGFPPVPVKTAFGPTKLPKGVGIPEGGVRKEKGKHIPVIFYVIHCDGLYM